MEILMLEPAVKSTIWGGTKLINDYGFEPLPEKDNISEAWLLSAHSAGPSIITNGQYRGKTLNDVLEIWGRDALGTNSENVNGFPLLIKLIDANDKLSIQVHPGDEYARKHENENGKTEAWYIIEAKPGAKLIYGINRKLSREEFYADAKNGNLLDDVNFVEVKPGDVVFIPSGMLHAIGDGIFLAEVQQSSNTTYRLYDYNRLQKDGTMRELNLEKGTDVVDLNVPTINFLPEGKPEKTGDAIKTYLTGCEFFTMTRVELNGTYEDAADKRSFVSLLVLEGMGNIVADGISFPLKKGSSVFIPAGFGSYSVEGCNLTILESRT